MNFEVSNFLGLCRVGKVPEMPLFWFRGALLDLVEEGGYNVFFSFRNCFRVVESRDIWRDSGVNFANGFF